jgi:hypothetical protein
MKSIPELPASLAFKRVLDCTSGLFFNVNSNGEEFPLTSFLHGQRHAKSHQLKIKTTADSISEGAGDTENGTGNNLSLGYRSLLNKDCNILRVKTHISALEITEALHATNDATLVNKINTLLQVIHGSEELANIARGLAYNMVSGAWLWSNRDYAAELKVTVNYQGKTQIFNKLKRWPKYGVATPEQHDNGKPDPMDTVDLGELPSVILKAMQGEYVQIELIADIQMKPGQICHPSQLYLPKKREFGEQKVNREFYTLGEHYEIGEITKQVALTPEKINNGLRTLDRFHKNSDLRQVILPFEANGSCLNYDLHLRDKTNNIFTLLPKAIHDWNAISSDEKKYVIGWIIRGGVITSDAKKAKKKALKTETENQLEPTVN